MNHISVTVVLDDFMAHSPLFEHIDLCLKPVMVAVEFTFLCEGPLKKNHDAFKWSTFVPL